MKKWSLLTLVGADQPGIVAAVTQALANGHCDLGETTMMRMGGNFAMMLRVRHDSQDLAALLQPVSDELKLHLHIDDDVEAEHRTEEPDVYINVYGADRTGIVAEVTSKFAAAGLNIIDLETAMAGTVEKPIYIMTIEGQARQGIDTLMAVAKTIDKGIELSITPIETLRA